MKKKFRTFGDAREFVQSLDLRSARDWKHYCKSGKKPNNIPSNPNTTYQKDWKGFGDWLGKSFLSFQNAKKFVKKMQLQSYTQWVEFKKSGKRPANMPSNPPDYYGKEWTTWGDFLGTGSIAPINRKFFSYEKAKKILLKIKITTQVEYRKRAKSGKLPSGLPLDPAKSYKNKGWTTWGDFLGTKRIANQNRIFLTYDEAKKIARKMSISSQRQWQKLVSEGKIPPDIPTLPPRRYKKKWTSWGEFLGTQNKNPRDIEYLPFDEAKKLYQKIAKDHNIKSLIDWKNYLKHNKLPPNLPRLPEHVYSKENILRKKK